MRAAEDGELRVRAIVGIKGVTKRVEVGGHRHADPERTILHVSGRIDRHDFGIRPPVPFEWVVGRYVDLHALLVFVP